MGKQDKGRNKSRNDYRNNDGESQEKMGFENIRISEFKARNESQINALDQVQDNVLTFLLGPAGTAKTYLAVYDALVSLKHGDVKKIILARPAVEAGEHIGYLPGTIEEKLDPYMRPLLDNIQDLVGPELCRALIEEGVIQFIPLGYMRGRTFKNSYIILDEMQNATKEQLRLALTRIGDKSVCVVTADPMQIDLRNTDDSAVNDIVNLFRDQDGIGFYAFRNGDIVRAEIVKYVLKIYDKATKEQQEVVKPRPIPIQQEAKKLQQNRGKNGR